MTAAGFDWDDRNRNKCRSRGVSIAEIEAIFRGQIYLLPDPAHSITEQRVRAIGVGPRGRHIFVVFTLRQHGDVTLIRPISARYMHEKDVTHYEKQKAEIEKASDPQER